MKSVRTLLAGVAAVVAAGAVSTAAQANVVTFDDAAGNALVDQAIPYGGSFDDGGLTFTNFGSFAYIWDGSSPNGNGTNANIMAGFSTSDHEVITLTGGGAFNLRSIDMAISWYDGNPSETITINGTPITLTQGLQTYVLNLNNVSSVDISGLPSDAGYWLADNIDYNAVPEPATWVMAITGFGLLGASLRRRRAPVATMA